MAKGYDQHIERVNKINSFGRELARRSKSKCELCESSGVSLKVFEIPPVGAEPDISRCIFICEDCLKKIENLKKSKENDFRFLTNSIWSDVDIARYLSIFLLKEISKKYSWAESTLDNIYMDELTEEMIKSIKFE